MDLDQIYLDYFNDLYRYLYFLSNDHHQAEDLAHETFYRAFLEMRSSDIDEVRPWLFKVGYHVFIDVTRRHKRMVVSDHVTKRITEKIENGLSPEQAFLQKEGLHELLHYLEQLSTYEKHAILLCDFHQLKEREAAEILDLKLNTLKSHIYRGRRKMIEMIEGSERCEGR
ncbi:sigma-70 family RNA polymerase sigma factor [Alkalihalobacillus sp. NPDC078783]